MADRRKIELDIRLELTDYLQANYWFLFRNPLMVILSAFGVLLILLSLYMWLESPQGWHPVLFMPAGLVVVACLVIYVQTKRTMSSNKSLQQEIHYSFSDDGIDAAAQSLNSHVDWENVYKVVETRHNFLVFLSRSLMYIMPKRCFLSSEQIESFQDLARSHVSRTKLRSKPEGNRLTF